jgi:hypothetical protein
LIDPMRWTRVAAGAALAMSLCSWPVTSGATPKLSDEAVKARIIRESIASYPGNCPCPFNSARNGSRCGARSAYNRRGGYAPICFASDIGKDQVQAYRRAHGL